MSKRLTAKQKEAGRKEILEDVARRIFSHDLTITRAAYCAPVGTQAGLKLINSIVAEANKQPNGVTGIPLQPVVGAIVEKCSVCARGALFFMAVDRHNLAHLNVTGGFDRFTQNRIFSDLNVAASGEQNDSPLLDYFSKRDLELFEDLFEGSLYTSSDDRWEDEEELMDLCEKVEASIEELIEVKLEGTNSILLEVDFINNYGDGHLAANTLPFLAYHALNNKGLINRKTLLASLASWCDGGWKDFYNTYGKVKACSKR